MSRQSAATIANPIRARLTEILEGYIEVKARRGPHERTQVHAALNEACERFLASEAVRAHPTVQVASSTGSGEWAAVPWIAFLDSRETDTPQSGVTVMLLFCAKMTGVYLTVQQGVNATKKELRNRKKAVWEKLRAHAAERRPTFAALEAHGFRLDDGIELGGTTDQARSYAPATIAHKLYVRGSLPTDAALLADLDAVLGAYDRYVAGPRPARLPAPARPRLDGFDRVAALRDLTTAITARGFVFEPWQVAAYVTALRTKPFVILAGVSGTGKSRLPALVAELTGGAATLLPVRPDWTDSSDVLGYTDLGGRFRPGPLLELARAAASRPEQHHVCIVDEMNLARVEQYFAEVLSRIEDRETPGGGPLLSQRPTGADAEWAAVGLPANLALVGTVNMDETTHGFSRKVLDRAFSLEISDIDLGQWRAIGAVPAASRAWPAAAFAPRAVRLGALEPSPDEEALIARAVEALTEVNELLGRAQLQVGYRVRDEVALFLIHAREVDGAFTTRVGAKVDPLDLALMMKILPRIAGGSASLREVVAALFGWSIAKGKAWSGEDDAAPALSAWRQAGRPASMQAARYPRMAARLALMHERLLGEGYTSFWA